MMGASTMLASCIGAVFVGMALATASAGTGAVVVLQALVEVACIAAIDAIVGGVARRRLFLWLAIDITLGVVQQWPIGHACAHIAKFVVVDYVMPRTKRQRGAPSLYVGVVVYLLAVSEGLECFKFDRAAGVVKALYVLVMIVGVPLVEKRLSAFSDADVILFGGYATSRMLAFNLTLSAVDANEYFVSAALMVSQRFITRMVISYLKVLLGDEWSLGVGLILFTITELGPVALLTSAPVSDVSFWLVLALQECNSLLRNVGVYERAIAFVRSMMNRPLSDDSIADLSVRRRVLAPCDNISEVCTPVVVLLAVAFASFSSSIPVDVVVSVCVALAMRTLFAIIEFALWYVTTVSGGTPIVGLWLAIANSDVQAHVVYSILIVIIAQPTLFAICTLELRV